MPCADLRVVFRVAAGPRRGFGHLVRAHALARAMGVRPLIAVRGGKQVVDAALALGCDVIARPSTRSLARLGADVVVVDDPVKAEARRWIAAARRAGCFVVSVHDLGVGCPDGDLVVDGSVARQAAARGGATLAGPRYAVLDPVLAAHRHPVRTRARRARARVLISLGGGPRTRRALAIARAIARAQPDAHVRIVAGFATRGAVPRAGLSRIRWIRSARGLARELARADVAVVGGGVSLYEACALAVPAVGVPVVREQEPTVAALARRGAALGALHVNASPGQVAARAIRLLSDPRLRHRLARAGPRLVDGRGAARVALAIAKGFASHGALR